MRKTPRAGLSSMVAADMDCVRIFLEQKSPCSANNGRSRLFTPLTGTSDNMPKICGAQLIIWFFPSPTFNLYFSKSIIIRLILHFNNTVSRQSIKKLSFWTLSFQIRYKMSPIYCCLDKTGALKQNHFRKLKLKTS